jgi:hypothetical protein
MTDVFVVTVESRDLERLEAHNQPVAAFSSERAALNFVAGQQQAASSAVYDWRATGMTLDAVPASLKRAPPRPGGDEPEEPAPAEAPAEDGPAPQEEPAEEEPAVERRHARHSPSIDGRPSGRSVGGRR